MRTARIVRNLLGVARTHEPERSRFDLNSIIDDVINLRAYRLSVSQINLVKAFDDLPEVFVDRYQIHQVVLNLVNNAIKFTDKGHVIVRASAVLDGEISHVRFEVEDTGIGIAKDKQQLVFESFQQADSGTSRKYGGTGLGLAISRQLIELMGGTLMLYSEEGKGSKFVIMLPYECPQQQPEAPAQG